MRIQKFVFFAFFLMIVSLFLCPQVSDLGDDPEKVKIVSTKEISATVDMEFLNWSPRGNYFAFYSGSTRNSHIFNKDGTLYKVFIGKMLDWSSDEERILCFEKDLLVYSLISSEVKKIEYKEKTYGVQFGSDGNLVYYRSFFENGKMITAIFSMNINSGIKAEIYRFISPINKPYILLHFENDAFKYVSDGKVFYLKESQAPGKYSSVYDLCVLNMGSGVEKILYSNVSEMKFNTLWNGKTAIKVNRGGVKDAAGYFISEDGLSIGKIVDDELQRLFANNEFIEWGKTLLVSSLDLFGNGELVLVGKVTQFESDEGENFLDSFIYLYNFHNKMIKIDLPNPSYCVGVSPTMSSFIAKVATTEPIFSADHQYLVQPATMAYRLITLGRGN